VQDFAVTSHSLARYDRLADTSDSAEKQVKS
jgi:hypothetical protein